MSYVIGIDSGGTHYRVRACDLQGRCLGDYSGATANHYYIADKGEVQRRVREAIAACLKQFGGRLEACKFLVCGTTGLDSAEDEAFLYELYSTLPGLMCPVLCMNDAELALYTVTGGDGVIVISGTGSIAFGRSPSGETARVGGWALSIMGEEGSGTWVSRYALRHLGNWFDKVVPESLLVQMLQEELGITVPKQLSDLSTEITDEMEKQPGLGEIVDRAAEQGDPWAQAILKAAAVETLSLVSNLIGVLKLEKETEIPVGIWGSNILDSRLHRQTFAQLLQEKYPNTKLCLPQKTATEGAVELALKKLKQHEDSFDGGKTSACESKQDWEGNIDFLPDPVANITTQKE